jgi:hypothetical protein
MKKTIITITLACYIAVSCGVVINFHYCMDRLASVALFESGSTKCGICGMHKKSHGCCRDEVKIIKMAEDQQIAIAAYDFQSFSPTVIIPSQFINEPAYDINESRHWHNHSPPLLSLQDTYLQNGVFRI